MSRRASKISVISKDPDKPKHRSVFFMEGIPCDTKLLFKSACARSGQTMRDVVIKLMREYVARVG